MARTAHVHVHVCLSGGADACTKHCAGRARCRPKGMCRARGGVRDADTARRARSGRARTHSFFERWAESSNTGSDWPATNGAAQVSRAEVWRQAHWHREARQDGARGAYLFPFPF